MNVPNNDLKVVPQHLHLAKTVIAFWLLGWFLKADFFIPYIFSEVIRYPLTMDFFPALLRSPLVLQFFYVFPLFAFLVIFKPNYFYCCLAAVTMVSSSAVLLLHQDTHNDATFLTSFWVAVWVLWFVTQMHRTDRAFLIHARSLALCVIAVIFFGSFIGKLTPEYLNGTVFADIFMRQNFGWVGQWVRAHYSEEVIRLSFYWVSKLIIFGEGFLAFAPIWPFGIVYRVGIGVMLAISLFTTWRIFSVLFCLTGLLYAFRNLPRPQDEEGS
jgi:hypothetical protein